MRTSKPVALDLCCGLGGGGKGLKAAGFFVVGVDIEAWPNEHNDAFILGDMRELKGSEIEAKYGKVSFIWASPPCQQFSYRSFPFKRCRHLRDNVPPDKSIWLACERLAKELDCPIVIENVRGAEGVNYLHPEWFMGKAATHYGSFYLWGDVPTMLPYGGGRKGFKRIDPMYKGGKPFQGQGNRGNFGWNDPAVQNPRNGYKVDATDGKQWRGNSPTHADIKEFHRGGSQNTSFNSKARKLWSAQAAMIPFELSYWIGQCYYPEPPA